MGPVARSLLILMIGVLIGVGYGVTWSIERCYTVETTQ